MTTIYTWNIIVNINLKENPNKLQTIREFGEMTRYKVKDPNVKSGT